MQPKKSALYRSYGFWMSVIAAVLLVVKSILDGYGIKIEEKYLSDIADGVLGLLIVLGIIAGPKPDEPKESNEAKPDAEAGTHGSDTLN